MSPRTPASRLPKYHISKSIVTPPMSVVIMPPPPYQTLNSDTPECSDKLVANSQYKVFSNCHCLSFTWTTSESCKYNPFYLLHNCRPRDLRPYTHFLPQTNCNFGPTHKYVVSYLQASENIRHFLISGRRESKHSRGREGLLPESRPVMGAMSENIILIKSDDMIYTTKMHLTGT